MPTYTQIPALNADAVEALKLNVSAALESALYQLESSNGFVIRLGDAEIIAEFTDPEEVGLCIVTPPEVEH